MPLKAVTSFLEVWIEALEQRNTDLHKLTLVLEKDSEDVKQMLEYIYQGDLDGVYGGGSFSSLENLEFYSDLKRVMGKIETLNQSRVKLSKINFEIIGPESTTKEPYYQMSLEDSFDYFIKKRDQETAQYIFDYCDKRPEQKLLFFYGNAHLMRGIRNKLPQVKTAFGYFLAHILTERFGMERVLTVNQEPGIVYFNTTRNGDVCDGLVKDKSIRSIYLQRSWLQNQFFDLLRTPTYDATIVHRDKETPQFPLDEICSKNVVNNGIKRLEYIYSFSPKVGYLAKTEANEIIRQLKHITKENFGAAQAWRDWFDNNSDAVDFFPSPVANNSKEYSKKYLPNLIGILKLGTISEKARARELLVKETGKDFSEPLDYLKWVRTNFFKVSY
jgi:hypothetical protein